MLIDDGVTNWIQIWHSLELRIIIMAVCRIEISLLNYSKCPLVSHMANLDILTDLSIQLIFERFLWIVLRAV